MPSQGDTTTPLNPPLRGQFEEPFTCEEELTCLKGILARDDHRDSRHIAELRKHNYKLIRAAQLCMQQIEELEQNQPITHPDLRQILRSTVPELFSEIFVSPSLLSHKWAPLERINTPSTDG